MCVLVFWGFFEQAVFIINVIQRIQINLAKLKQTTLLG